MSEPLILYATPSPGVQVDCDCACDQSIAEYRPCGDQAEALHLARVEAGRRGGLARAAGADMKAVGALGGRSTYARHGSAHMAAVGARGWAALCANKGVDAATDRLHQWRLDHPSSLEQIVAAALEGLGCTFERYAVVLSDPPIYGDFVFADRLLVLEVDGRRWHSNDPLHGEDRLARDRRRNARLEAAGWRVVHVDEAIVRDPVALRIALEWALQE